MFDIDPKIDLFARALVQEVSHMMDEKLAAFKVQLPLALCPQLSPSKLA